MIRMVSNPKMSRSEIDLFRENFSKCISKDFTQEEKTVIRVNKERMSKVAKEIISNNGGKNPILGY